MIETHVFRIAATSLRSVNALSYNKEGIVPRAGLDPSVEMIIDQIDALPEGSPRVVAVEVQDAVTIYGISTILMQIVLI